MAITIRGLLFIGALATMATLGLFVDFTDEEGNPDHATQVLVPFLAAILWGTFGLSASDVSHIESGVTTHIEMAPLFWMGVLLALLTGVYGIYILIKSVYSETTESELEMVPK